MLELLKILFFSKTIIISGGLVNIEISQPVKFELSQPLKAINNGADFRIDITEMIPENFSVNPSDSRKLLNLIPPGGIEVVFISSQSDYRLTALFNGNIAYTDEEVYLIIRPQGGFPIDVEFNTVIITSDVELKSVAIIWHNSGI